MGENFSLEDFEQIEEDDELKPTSSDEDGDFFILQQALPVREDGIKPMTDETSRGYFQFRTDGPKRQKFLKGFLPDEDTERIKSGIVRPSNTIGFDTRQIRLKALEVVNSDTQNPFDRNADEVKTRKIKKDVSKTGLDVEAVDDFARKILAALKSK